MDEATAEKNLEKRLRGRAARLGLLLRKSRLRRPDKPDFPTWYLVDERNVNLAECRSLEQVDDFLRGLQFEREIGGEAQ